jgi:3-oxoacyl-[acyl-carrier protein] reductase
MQIDLAGKVILITGGTGALGSALVRCALEEKARVYFTYCRNESAARELERHGAQAFRADLRQRKDIDRFKDTLKKQTARLDGLVMNAGIVRDRTLANLAEEEFDDVLEVNLTANFLLAKKLLPLLYKKEGAKVVAVASRVGIAGGFGESNYAASKAGLIALTKTLARETARKKMCVNAVAPGFMMSGMTSGLPEPIYQRQREESAFGNFMEPLEIARFIVYLLSDWVENVTGQFFSFDSRTTKIF